MKMKTQMKNFVLLLAAVGLVAGCASTTGAKRSDKVESTVADTRGGLEATKVLISETLASLDSMQLESTVLPDAYAAFQKQVKGVGDAAVKLKKNSVAMQEAGKVKFDAWKAELETITNEQIKKTSMKGMNEAIAKHEDLLKLLKESGTVLDPFVSDLGDIVKYLDLDLSKESIKKISGAFGQIKKTDKSGKKVQKWIDDVVAELAKAESKPAVQ